MEKDIEDIMRIMEDPDTFQHHINDAATTLGVEPMMTITEEGNEIPLSMTAAVKQLRLILNLSPYESVTVWQGRVNDNRSRNEPQRKSSSNKENETKVQLNETASEEGTAATNSRTAIDDDSGSEGPALMRGGNDDEA